MAKTWISCVICTALFSSHVKSELSCGELHEDYPSAFKWNNGNLDICSASSIPSPTNPEGECYVSSTDFHTAHELCHNIGARLCTAEEIQAGATTSAPCSGSAEKTSYCWINKTLSSDSIGREVAFLTRCRVTNKNPVIMSPVTFRGTVKCCASGVKVLGPIDRNQGLKAECARYTCGYSCKEQPGCGWSSELQKCAPGKKTRKEEWNSGDCANIEVPGVQSGQNDECKRYVCGEQCFQNRHLGCGWKGKQNRCIGGWRANTSKAERRMGDCADVPLGDLANKVVDNANRCKNIHCGYECSLIVGCGWSSTRSKCIDGGTTTKREMTLCASGYSTSFEGTATSNDPCAVHVCPSDCSSISTCGWASARGKCITGAKTSNKERVSGECAGSSASIIKDNKWCQQWKCGQTCKNNPPCGWSRIRNGCYANKTTNDRDLLQCTNNDTVAPTATPPTNDETRPPTRPPTKLPTSKPTKLPTSKPTRFPTAPPTHRPTRPPTHQPTKRPTAPPTRRPTNTPTAPCVDTPPNWRDSDGDDCETYVSRRYCTQDGGYGSNWDTSQNWMSYATQGITAPMACCGCGGGSHGDYAFKTYRPTPAPTTPPTKPPSSPPTNLPTRPPTNPPTSPPTNPPTSPPTSPPSTPPSSPPTQPSDMPVVDPSCVNVKGFKDSLRRSCKVYTANNLCLPDGSPGAGWASSAAVSSFKRSDGYDPTTACCACGGGSTGRQLPSPTPPPPGQAPPPGVGSGLNGERSMFPCSVLHYPSHQPSFPYSCGASAIGPEKICLNQMASSWQTAYDFCHAAGARLCTIEELRENVSQGTGCRMDKHLIWAANSCEGGGHMVAYGRYPFLGDTSLREGCRTEPASVRCCADVFDI